MHGAFLKDKLREIIEDEEEVPPNFDLIAKAYCTFFDCEEVSWDQFND